MRFYFIGLLLLCTCCFAAYGQQDSTAGSSVLKPVDPNSVHPFLSDSAAQASRQRLQDSAAMFFIKPDSAMINSISSMTDTGFENLWMHPTQLKNVADRRMGSIRHSRQPWVLDAAALLLLFLVILNAFVGKEIELVLRSFTTKHILSQTDKDMGFVSLWTMIGLFLIFCFSLALLLCQVAGFYNITYPISGFRLFVFLALATAILLILKFALLKFLGFLFDVGALVRAYIAILNLTCFSISFVFLAAAVCFSLIPGQFTAILLIFTAIISTIILIWQFIRNSLGIVSDFRFHKFYLIVYLCALEFCPLLILIKAINR